MRAIIFSALFLFGTTLVFGQIAISEPEYREAYRRADYITDALPHRRTKNEESFTKGKRSGYEKHMTETLPPDKSRYIFESEYRGEREDRQVITIGNDSYCKEGKEKWEKTNCDRLTGIPSMSILSREYTKSEVLFDNNPVTQYRSYLTYSSQLNDAKKTVRTMYSEYKFQIDKDGKIVGSESTVGEIGSKEISTSSITVYEYGLTNLKIEAPIK